MTEVTAQYFSHFSVCESSNMLSQMHYVRSSFRIKYCSINLTARTHCTKSPKSCPLCSHMRNITDVCGRSLTGVHNVYTGRWCRILKIRPGGQVGLPYFAFVEWWPEGSNPEFRHTRRAGHSAAVCACCYGDVAVGPLLGSSNHLRFLLATSISWQALLVMFDSRKLASLWGGVAHSGCITSHSEWLALFDT